MQTTKLPLLGLLVLTAAASTALAGYSPADPALQVFESGGSGLAIGSLAGVRAGSNSDDIGCWLDSNPTGDTSGGCSATKNGITYSCSFEKHNFFAYFFGVVGSMTAQSLIYFAWDASRTCTFLQITEDSAYGPRPL